MIETKRLGVFHNNNVILQIKSPSNKILQFFRVLPTPLVYCYLCKYVGKIMEKPRFTTFPDLMYDHDLQKSQQCIRRTIKNWNIFQNIT